MQWLERQQSSEHDTCHRHEIAPTLAKTMANTYTQLYVHVVFAVKNRDSLIHTEIEEQLYPYLGGACKNRGHHLRAIGGMPDHLHMLIGMSPTESVSEMVKYLKIETSKWIHLKWGMTRFAWQTGYAAFTYSKSLLPPVENYILNQKAHHARHSFTEEILQFFADSGMEYDERYILQEVRE